MSENLLEKMKKVNEDFDYGTKGKLPWFWINMLKSQVNDELEEENKLRFNGSLNDEFFDCMLVSLKALMNSNEDFEEVAERRLSDIKSRQKDIENSYCGNGYKNSGDSENESG